MQADFLLDHDVLTSERPQKVYLMAHFAAGPAPGESRRRPLNLSVVIDRSGSMAGEKIDYTRQAAQVLVQNLGVRDTLSIVLYNENVETILPPEKVQRKDIIGQRIAAIKASGTTNLSSGWLEGCKWVAENMSAETLNRVILMSDGLANRGVTDMQQLITIARQKFGEGVSTTTMGLGKDFNEDLLMAIANAGGGSFYFIESPEVTPVIFKEELEGLLNVVGQNLMVTIEWSAHVTGVRQLNAYPERTEAQRITFRLGDVYGDEVKALLLELSTPALRQIGQQQIATLRFEYDELTETGSTHHTWEKPVMVNVQPGEIKALPKPEVKSAVLLLQAAEARRAAVRAADSGQYNSASQMLRTIADAIEKSGVRSDQLVEEQRALMRQATEMERGAETYDQYSRKMMATEAFYTMVNRHGDTMVMRQREQARRQKPITQAHAIVPQDEIQVERRDGVPPRIVVWKDREFELKGDLIRIGRANHNEIVINADGVSRFHCQVVRRDDGLYLEDLGSTNGTMISGKLVEQPYRLSVGDVAYLCDEKLMFSE